MRRLSDQERYLIQLDTREELARRMIVYIQELSALRDHEDFIKIISYVNEMQAEMDFVTAELELRLSKDFA